jgi:putative heme iron utilization protein
VQRLPLIKFTMNATLKDFLEECYALGLVRLIVTNDGAVLEAKGTIEKLFYAELEKGRYANMHAEVFEFHLNMDKISQVKFETGEAKRGNFTTYAIRLIGAHQESALLSIFLQWGKPGEYAVGQIEAWEALQAKYGADWQITQV